jgi:hypothetical protein
MEIDMAAPRVVDVKRRATMLDKTTILERNIQTLNPNKAMWIHTK